MLFRARRLGSENIPHERPGAVALHNLAFPVKISKQRLGGGIALLGGKEQPPQSLLRIGLHALAFERHQALGEMSGRMAVGGGGIVQPEGSLVVRRDRRGLAAKAIDVGHSNQSVDGDPQTAGIGLVGREGFRHDRIIVERLAVIGGHSAPEPIDVAQVPGRDNVSLAGGLLQEHAGVFEIPAGIGKPGFFHIFGPWRQGLQLGSGEFWRGRSERKEVQRAFLGARIRRNGQPDQECKDCTRRDLGKRRCPRYQRSKHFRPHFPDE